MVTAVGIRHKTFGTLSGPLDRLLHLARSPRDNRFLGIVVDLRTEATTNVGRNDAELVLRNVQHKRTHQKPDDMRVLAGGVERIVAAVWIVIAKRGSRLHRVRDQ